MAVPAWIHRVQPFVFGVQPGLQSLLHALPAWRGGVARCADACLRGIGQVIFSNNSVSGLLILIAVVVGAAPRIWLLGLLGLATSTSLAHVLAYSRSSLAAGLFGFNGFLTGLALPTFLHSPPAYAAYRIPSLLLLVVVFAAFSTVLTASLGTFFGKAGGVPAFTAPFCLATMLALAASFQFATIRLDAQPVLPDPQVLPAQETAAAMRSEAGGSMALALVHAVARGVSQVFLVDNTLSGLLILLAITVYSRIAAAAAAAGSAVGAVTAILVQADGHAIVHGLWGFNSALTCVAVGGMFFRLNGRAAAMAVFSAVLAAFTFAFLSTLLAPYAMPTLTAPFVIAAVLVVMSRGRSPFFIYIKAPTTPEDSLAAPPPEPWQPRSRASSIASVSSQPMLGAASGDASA